MLQSEEKFRRNFSDRILLAITSSPELLQMKTPYYKRILENLIEFEIKRIVREKYFLATEDLFSQIRTNHSIVTIREKLQFEGLDSILHKSLFKLHNEGFIFVSKSNRLVRSARKLLQKTLYPKDQLSPEKRVLDYISDITRYMKTYHRNDIKNRALTYFSKVKNAPLLQGTEPLRKAATLVFLASREFGVPNVAKFLYKETGVSTYLSLLDNRKKYTDPIYDGRVQNSSLL